MFLFISKRYYKSIFLTIFKYISCSYLSNPSCLLVQLDSYSNTSHVLIYPKSFVISPVDSKIQIHLMFLFILPCLRYPFPHLLIQIHLMFLFINTGWEEVSKDGQIQIHLMFLFIRPK